jgi:hypothetical protein
MNDEYQNCTFLAPIATTEPQVFMYESKIVAAMDDIRNETGRTHQAVIF